MSVTVHRVNHPGYDYGYGYEVRDGGTAVDAGRLAPDGDLFAAWSDAAPDRSELRASSTAGVLERLAERHGGTVVDE